MNHYLVQKRLAEGLSSWLTFEFSCVRGYLFSEKYLTLPVGQLLLASCNDVVRSEVAHPVLNFAGQRGRPLQIDFAVGPESKPMLVVETKWLGNSSVKHSDILWDIVRLELACHHWNCDAFFVLAGLEKKIQALFNSASFSFKTGNGKTRTLLPIADDGRRDIRVQYAPPAQRRRVEEELAGIPGIPVPSTVNCHLPLRYPKVATNLTFSAWVWRIIPAVDRRSFQFGAPGA